MRERDPKERLALLQAKVNDYDPGTGGSGDYSIVWESLSGALAYLPTKLARNYARLVYVGDRTSRGPLTLDVIRILNRMASEEGWRVQKESILPGVARILITEELLFREDMDEPPEIGIRSRVVWMDITRQAYHKSKWYARIRSAARMFDDPKDQITSVIVDMNRNDARGINRNGPLVGDNLPLKRNLSTVG